LFDVLEHVADESRALAEIRRVLAPGGTLFLHVPAHQLLFANNDRESGHYRRYGRRRLRRALSEAGFAVDRLTFTNALLFPLIAPLVLGLRCLEELGLAARKRYTNLSWSNPPLLAGTLEAAFACELHLSRRLDLPLGHSLAAIART
jgi:SAM-dependent methyltransferase